MHAGSKYKPGTATNLVMGWMIQSNQAMNHQSGTFKFGQCLDNKVFANSHDFESGDVSRGVAGTGSAASPRIGENALEEPQAQSLRLTCSE
jgi:hypothetical protein